MARNGSQGSCKPSEVPILLGEPATLTSLGVILVDHGSRRAESNEMLLEVAELFARTTGYPIVEPAHMELAEPSIRTAFARCVSRGAKTVVVHPYFLLPGRHWVEDVPALVAAAAREHPGVRCCVTAPLGLHPLMIQVMQDRIRECLERAGLEAVANGTTAPHPGPLPRGERET
jgi:sirohydrochlorin ferrochelatase